MPPLKLTLEQLAQYGGSDPAKPLLLAVCGTILDVTAGRLLWFVAASLFCWNTSCLLQCTALLGAPCLLHTSAGSPATAVPVCLSPCTPCTRPPQLQVPASTAQMAPTHLPARSAPARWPSFPQRWPVSSITAELSLTGWWLPGAACSGLERAERACQVAADVGGKTTLLLLFCAG